MRHIKRPDPTDAEVRDGIARSVERFKEHKKMSQAEAEKYATDLARKRAKKEGVN